MHEFVEGNGHARVPQHFVTSAGIGLGRWAHRQREAYRVGRLAESSYRALDALPGWSWGIPAGAIAAIGLPQSLAISGDVRVERWFIPGLSELIAFVARHGTASVPFSYRAPSGYRLGYWCANRRRAYGHGHLAAGHSKVLEQLPGWRWNEESSVRTRAELAP